MSLRASTRSKSSGECQLQVESLERRELLSVAPAVELDVLRIYGTSGADRVVAGSYLEEGVAMVSVTISDAADGSDEGTSYHFEAASIRKIVCRLEEGDDYFRNDAGIFSVILGNAGEDTLIGGAAYDRIFGGNDNDLIYGYGSRDVVQAGGGNDTIYGGDGNDLLKGQAGFDLIYGEAGDDVIYGGAGDDTVDAGTGADLVYGQTGYDLLHGGAGSDLVFGHNADDTIYGGDGDDALYGGGENDAVFGEGGLDRLFGGRGDDVMDGGQGNDGVYGGPGTDELAGGDGNDVIQGNEDDDTLLGQAGDDRLFGGEGADTLYGGDGAEQIFGEAGNDGMFGGGTEVDSLTGGLGSDRFLVHGDDTASDVDGLDAELVFVDAVGTYTGTPANWTDAIIEKCDQALAQMQAAAGSARILADSLSSSPVYLYLAQSISLGASTAGLNYFDGYQREIYVKSTLTDEQFKATIVHEFGHCWDSTLEGNAGWNGFARLYDESTSEADYARQYGEGSAQEDWSTNWEYYFGYYRWAAPDEPSSLLLAKQAAVDDFFTGFGG